MDLSTIHGPNYLAISAKARQELLCAISEAMNMEFSNPAERSYVTQIRASPHSISLSLSLSLSQTYHYSFSFIGFQITILNSLTQFLSVVSLVCMFMVVWPWVWVLLFLWVCGHVCM